MAIQKWYIVEKVKTRVAYDCTFEVPKNIRRSEGKKVSDWRVEIAGSPKKYFPDENKTEEGACTALKKAIKELIRLLGVCDQSPAPLYKTTSHKINENGIPVGVSKLSVSPEKRVSKNGKWYIKKETYFYAVHMPVFGGTARNLKCYVCKGRPPTSRELDLTLEKAIKIREEALRVYREKSFAYTKKIRQEQLEKLQDMLEEM